MATAGSIIIDLLMKTGSFETDIARAEKALARFNSQKRKTATTDNFEVKTTGLDKAISGIGSLRTAVAAFAGFTAVQKAIDLTDSATKLTGILQNVTSENINYARSLEDVSRISSLSQANITDTGIVYARIANSTAELGATQAQVADVTETLSLALKVNGATSAETASTLIQLSQAFGKGKLDGDEFRTAMEAAPNVMRQLATSLGVPFGALKDLASQGKLTADILLKAYSDPAYLQALRKQAESMQTIRGGFTEIANEAVLAFKRIKESFAGQVIIGPILDGLKEGTIGALKLATGQFDEFFGNIQFETVSTVGLMRTLTDSLTPLQKELIALEKSPFVDQQKIDQTRLKIDQIQKQIDRLKNSKSTIDIDVRFQQAGDFSISQKRRELTVDRQRLASLEGQRKGLPRTVVNSNRIDELDVEIKNLKTIIENEEKQIAALKNAEKSLSEAGKKKAQENSLKEFIKSNLTKEDKTRQEIKDLTEEFKKRTEGISTESAIYKEAKTAFDKAKAELESKLAPKSSGSTKKTQAQKDQEEIQKFIDKLTEQNATLGKSDEEVLRYEASLLKLNNAQSSTVFGLIDTNEQLRKKNEEEEKAKSLALEFKDAQSKFNEEYAILNKLLKEGKITYDVYTKAVEAQLKALSDASPEITKAKEELAKLNNVLDQTPTAKLKEQRDLIAQIYEQFNGNFDNPQFQEAIDVALGRTSEKTEETAFDIEAAFKRAAENSQDALADFLFDPFEDGLDGMVEQFANAVRRMVAEAAAAQIFKTLFGDSGSSNIFGGVFDGLLGPSSGGGGGFDFGGLFSGAGLFGGGGGYSPLPDFVPAYTGGDFGGGGFLSSIGDLFGGFFADGGSPPMNKISVVGERGPELFVPRTSGTIIPNDKLGSNNSQTQINVDFKVNATDANSFRKSQGQIVSDMAKALSMSKRYS